MFKCQYCNKQLSNQVCLDYHIDVMMCRKPTKTCPLCGVIFASKQRCQTHISKGVCQKKVKSKGKVTLKLKSKYDGVSRDELIRQLEQTKTKYETLESHPQNVNIQQNIQQVDNRKIYMFPATFGKEKINHVCQVTGEDVCKDVIKHSDQHYIYDLCSKIHNSKKVPEYRNVYVPSERSQYALVSDGEKFQYRPKKTIITQIIDEKRYLLNKYVDDHGDQLSEKLMHRYDLYQSQIDDDPEFRKELELEIGGFLLNMRDVIAPDEKTRRLLKKVEEGDLDLPDEDEVENQAPQTQILPPSS